jgi:aspartyl-tRNA(Asn)/glutamyl-tRNA(Gln) amidotransferase subunit C
VVGYVEQLNEVKTDGIQPMAHAVELHNVFRDDALADSLPREAALANAPKRDSECYRVPAVLGE